MQPHIILILQLALVGLLLAGRNVAAQPGAPKSAPTPRPPAVQDSYRGEAQDLAVASIFAPVFYQALGDHPRHDYITNFDFDNDWRGDNNWRNADDTRFPLKAYVYYSVGVSLTE